MYLVSLLVLPFLIALFSMAFSRGRITWKEFGCILGAVTVVIAAGAALARYRSTLDYEVWNGRISQKKREIVSCSHSYRCNCRTVSSGSGKNRSTHTVCQTCYEHSYDVDWAVYTTTNERIEINRIDRQGIHMPGRWGQAYVNEPVSTTHSFTNYVLADPDSVLRHHVDKSKYDVPEYPIQVYDYYRNNKFRAVGYTELHERDWNWLLAELNGDLGPAKEVNLIIVAVKTSDQAYQYAVEDKWVGGKKNDVILVMGVPDYPKISWAKVISWTNASALKVDIKDDVLEIGSMERRDDIIKAVRHRVLNEFVRRDWHDFEYLLAGIQPGTGATIFLLILGIAVALGLTWYFYHEDPFNDHPYKPAYYSSVHTFRNRNTLTYRNL